MAYTQGPQGAGGVNVMTWGTPMHQAISPQVPFANHVLQAINQALSLQIPPIPHHFPHRNLASYTVIQVPPKLHFNAPQPLPVGYHAFNRSYAPGTGYSGVRPFNQNNQFRQHSPLAPGYTHQGWQQAQPKPSGSYAPASSSQHVPWKQPQVPQSSYPAATYTAADYKESLKNAEKREAEGVNPKKKIKKGNKNKLVSLFKRGSKKTGGTESTGKTSESVSPKKSGAAVPNTKASASSSPAKIEEELQREFKNPLYGSVKGSKIDQTQGQEAPERKFINPLYDTIKNVKTQVTAHKEKAGPTSKKTPPPKPQPYAKSDVAARKTRKRPSRPPPPTGAAKKEAIQNRPLPPLPDGAKEHLVENHGRTSVDSDSRIYESIGAVIKGTEGVESDSAEVLSPKELKKSLAVISKRAQAFSNGLKAYEQALGKYIAKGTEVRKEILNNQSDNKKSLIKAANAYVALEKTLKETTLKMAAHSSELLALKGQLEAAMDTQEGSYPAWYASMEADIGKFQKLQQAVDTHMFNLEQTRLVDSEKKQLVQTLKSNQELLRSVGNRIR